MKDKLEEFRKAYWDAPFWLQMTPLLAFALAVGITAAFYVI